MPTEALSAHAAAELAAEPNTNNASAKRLLVLSFCRNSVPSLRCQLQKQSQVVPFHPETVWIRSARDGDKNLAGSGRDDQQSARATGSCF